MPKSPRRYQVVATARTSGDRVVRRRWLDRAVGVRDRWRNRRYRSFLELLPRLPRQSCRPPAKPSVPGTASIHATLHQAGELTRRDEAQEPNATSRMRAAHPWQPDRNLRDLPVAPIPKWNRQSEYVSLGADRFLTNSGAKT